MSTTLNEALHAFQKDAPALQKSAINPHFKSRYLPLDVLVEKVLPLLNKHGLVLTQTPHYIATTTEVVPALKTRIEHVKSGEAIEGIAPLVLDKNNPQGQGSAITYMRRYALMGALSLVADVDDDANAASPRKSTTQTYVSPSEAKGSYIDI